MHVKKKDHPTGPDGDCCASHLLMRVADTVCKVRAKGKEAEYVKAPFHVMLSMAKRSFYRILIDIHIKIGGFTTNSKK